MKLYNGVDIREIGAGTYPFKEELLTAVPELVRQGYRLFDTSDNYRNEEYLGGGLESLDPEVLDQVTVITKYSDPRKSVRKAFEESSRKIFSKTKQKTRKADIYLMHWPYPYLWERRWREMESLYENGDCKAIGVCNFNSEKLQQLLSFCRVKPMINQFECHPMFQQKEIRKLMAETDTKLEAWYPLGHGDKSLLTNPVIVKLSEKYGKNAGQIILHFEVQEGVITLPKSTNPERIRTNLDVFDFTLTDEEMDEMRSLDTGRGSHNPDAPGVEEMLRGAFVIED